MTLLDRLWGTPSAEVPAPDPDSPANTPRSRRDRTPGGSPDVILEALSQKVLHYWLQNRHQTLFPLTVNLRTLSPDQAKAIATILAAALHLDQEPLSRAQEARTWLIQTGATPEILQSFDAILANPPALNKAIADNLHHNTAPYAYVAALIALDPREDGAAHLLDFLATRLSLPTTVIRSANRRYRR